MREADYTHPCPVEGCTVADVPDGKLMCSYHWRLVPPELRREVYRTWNRGHPRASYMPVRREAIYAAAIAERTRHAR